jgi:hypothetical protein
MANPIFAQPFQTGFALQDGAKLNELFGFLGGSVQQSITTTGATAATAFQLSAQVNNLTVVVAGATGAKLPAMNPGQYCIVFNSDGADAAVIYSDDSTIDGTAGATGVALSSTKRAIFFQMAVGVIISAQLGVVSA